MQTRRSSIPTILGIYKAFRHNFGSVSSEVDFDRYNGCGATRRRCFQFQYVPLGVLCCSFYHADSRLVADLQVYPSAFFGFVMSVGLYIVRWRRKRLNLPRPTFKAWDVIIIFNITKDVYLLVMPWYPPNGGVFAGDVSFWYATYVIAGIGM